MSTQPAERGGHGSASTAAGRPAAGLDLGGGLVGLGLRRVRPDAHADAVARRRARDLRVGLQAELLDLHARLAHLRRRRRRRRPGRRSGRWPRRARRRRLVGRCARRRWRVWRERPPAPHARARPASTQARPQGPSRSSWWLRSAWRRQRTRGPRRAPARVPWTGRRSAPARQRPSVRGAVLADVEAAGVVRAGSAASSRAGRQRSAAAASAAPTPRRAGGAAGVEAPATPLRAGISIGRSTGIGRGWVSNSNGKPMTPASSSTVAPISRRRARARASRTASAVSDEVAIAAGGLAGRGARGASAGGSGLQRSSCG